MAKRYPNVCKHVQPSKPRKVTPTRDRLVELMLSTRPGSPEARQYLNAILGRSEPMQQVGLLPFYSQETDFDFDSDPDQPDDDV